jgi:hypothetical protein
MKNHNACKIQLQKIQKAIQDRPAIAFVYLFELAAQTGKSLS